MTEKLVSKVLVLDNSPAHSERIKQFCDEHNLVALKVRKNRLMSVLRSNIDLGAILYADNYGGFAGRECRDRAAHPHHSSRIADHPAPGNGRQPGRDRRFLRHVFCAAYNADHMDRLKEIVDEYIFSLYYPCALVRGISEITENILSAQFKDLTTRWDTPCIVRDKVIFGEVFSLIPLESSWCRGYMMLQTEEAPILDALDGPEAERNFRQVNNLLGEITNLIWGAFKNRYIGDSAAAGSSIQVPLIINHKHKFISFGTENPQLCFLYTLTDESGSKSIRLFQRFIFNLSWSPEDFREIVHDTAELVESGELELF